MATKPTYKEQLLDPRWQRKRLEVLESAGWTCATCDATDKTLHVHHKQYLKGRMAWEYEDSELEVLCKDCHQSEHDDGEILKQLLAGTSTPSNLAVLGGFHKNSDWIDPALIESARQGDALAFAAGFVAYLTYGLCDIDEMLKVAEFAVSLHHDMAECRMVFEFKRGNIFGEDA